MKKKFIALLASLSLVSVPVFADNEKQIALGKANSNDNIEELKSLLGKDSDEIVEVDGNTLNEFLKDGSDNSLKVYSSVSVEFLNNQSGVEVEILTPENITEISDSTYRNAAIAAGAKNVKIQIASAVPVSGHGALAGVYKIFSDAGMDLNSEDISNAEQVINLEQLLSEQTNMKDNEISKFIAELHLEIITFIENNKKIENNDIKNILENIISNYNYDFSEDILNSIIEYGINFGKSDAAKDPETKKQFEQTLNRLEEISQSYKHGNVEVSINDMYYTDDRNEFAEENYDNILVIDYDVTNYDKKYEISSDYVFQLYADNTLEDQYFFDYTVGDVISPGRQGKAIVAFGFNGNPNKLELELSDMNTFDKKPVVIEVPKDLEVK